MKKALLTLLLTAGMLISAWAGNPAKLENLARQYRSQEGFEMVSVGRLGIRLLKGAIAVSGDLDEEDRAALKAFSGIKRLIIVDFEEASAQQKADFNRKAEKILNGMELILETRDGEECLRIYGVDDGEDIRDCILYSSDGALIITQGRIGLSHLGELMEMAE